MDRCSLLLVEGRSQSFTGGRAQSGPLTALIGYLNVPIKVLRFFQIFVGRAQPTFGWVWPALGYAPASCSHYEIRQLNHK